MAKQRHTTEEVIHKLQQADVLIGQEPMPAGVRASETFIIVQLKNSEPYTKE